MNAAKTFKALLRKEGPIFGLYMNLPEPSVVEMAKAVGFDFVRIDLEHSLMDPRELNELIRTANLLDIPVQVRISDLTDATKLLDQGVDGLVVPDVNSVERARRAIDAVKYHPVGMRGMYPVARYLDFGASDFAQYIATANDRVTLTIQIEDKEGIANIDSILALDGIDMVSTGKFDLSQSLGVPGKIGDPKVLEAEATIVKKTFEYGKMPAVMAGTAARVRELGEMGVRVVTVGPDAAILFKGLKETLASLKG